MKLKTPHKVKAMLWLYLSNGLVGQGMQPPEPGDDKESCLA